MAVVSKENDTLIHKKHANGKVFSPGRSCAINVYLVKHCETRFWWIFVNIFRVLRLKRHGFQRRKRHRNSDSYDSFRQVTINRRRDWNAVTINKPWQSRSIRRNFLVPISATSHPAAAVSHNQKINRSHDSLRAQYGRRTRCRVDTIRESLNSPCSASVILIDGNCAWS